MVSFLIKKLIGEPIPETDHKTIDFLIKKRIGKAIPEPELRMIGFLIKKFIGSRFLSINPKSSISY